MPRSKVAILFSLKCTSLLYQGHLDTWMHPSIRHLTPRVKTRAADENHRPHHCRRSPTTRFAAYHERNAWLDIAEEATDKLPCNFSIYIQTRIFKEACLSSQYKVSTCYGPARLLA